MENKQFGKFILEILKLPVVGFCKILVTTLNLVPTPVYEVHGLRGSDQHTRPDLRASHNKIRSGRRAHVGTLLVAWTRGAVFREKPNSNGSAFWCIYTEDFQDIQKSWIW